MSRRVARIRAFMIVFQFEFYSDFDITEAIDFVINLNDDDCVETVSNEQRKFIKEIATGVLFNKNEIDIIINENCKNWSFERLNKIDIAILRLAIYEIKFREDIPKGVSINEAVELAKIYGTDDSASFINGLLGKAFKEL